MRASGIVVVALLVVLIATPAPAQDAGALRREIEQLRKQLEGLTERLQRLEAQPAPQPVAPPPVAQPAPPGTMQQRGPGGGTGLSAEELLRPRQPFALYQQRGSGQLLFDMGIAGDFVASVTQRNVAKANGGTFAGQENRFFPREVELELFGQIDPYARGEVRIEAGEEAPGAETSVHLAEATLTLLTLPYGTQVKMGQMRTRFGWSNQIHEHDLPWIDRPNVLRNFFGGEGVTEKGVEVTIVPDLPFYLEGLVGVFNGDNETAFGRGSLRDPLLTARLRTFFELTDTQAIQLGISGASGQTPGEFRSTFAGADARYKFRPESWLHPLVTLTAEAIYGIRKIEVLDETGTTGPEGRTRDRFGWYAGLEVQPWRRWAGGVRYDWSQFALMPGREWAVEPYITFSPSEFLRFRLAYKRTERDPSVDFAGNGGNARNIVRGARGRIEISRGIPLLEVPSTRVDRSMGDVHPLGNPHFSLDPGLAPIITQNILDGLVRIAPQHRAAFEKNRAAFLAKVDEQMARWTKAMEPMRGAKVVAYHPSFIYFVTRFGLTQVGTVEDRPGIPPSPQHLVNLIHQMREDRVKVILVEPWNDIKLATRVAEEAGAKALVMASAVGAVKGADNYLAAIDYNVTALVNALR